MNLSRQGRRGRWTPILGLALSAFLALPLSAQSPTAVNIDVSPELLGVMVGALLPSPGVETPDTERLLSNLTLDPAVTRVLHGLGATGVQPRELWPPTPWELEQLATVLSAGAPRWLAEAIQVSVEHELPEVTPLGVLLVLVREPDLTTEAFLQRHGLRREAVQAFIDAELDSMVKTG